MNSQPRVYKIAVTGVGGGCGQGILKSLLMTKRLLEIYPVDVTPLAAGLYFSGCMPGTVLPKPEEDIDAWKVWAAETGIDLIIPGSDRDLPPLAKVAQEWKRDHICRVAVSSEKLVEMADDKWKTIEGLESVGAAFADTWLDRAAFLRNIWSTQWPVVLKPRFDAASRGFHLCNDIDEVDFYWERTQSPILQQYLEGDEYTCALFYDIDHNYRARFAMRRWLRNGDTNRAEVVDLPHLNEFLDTVGKKLRPYNPFGPINLQLRDVPGRGPVIFEINARISGSSVMRAHFGYNEADMLVKHMLDRLPVTQPRTKMGFAMRYWDELYLNEIPVMQEVQS